MKWITPDIAWNYEIEQINSIAFNPTKPMEFAVCATDQSSTNIFLRVS